MVRRASPHPPYWKRCSHACLQAQMILFPMPLHLLCMSLLSTTAWNFSVTPALPVFLNCSSQSKVQINCCRYSKTSGEHCRSNRGDKVCARTGDWTSLENATSTLRMSVHQKVTSGVQIKNAAKSALCLIYMRVCTVWNLACKYNLPHISDESTLSFLGVCCYV